MCTSCSADSSPVTARRRRGRFPPASRPSPWRGRCGLNCRRSYRLPEAGRPLPARPARPAWRGSGRGCDIRTPGSARRRGLSSGKACRGVVSHGDRRTAGHTRAGALSEQAPGRTVVARVMRDRAPAETLPIADREVPAPGVRGRHDMCRVARRPEPPPSATAPIRKTAAARWTFRWKARCGSARPARMATVPPVSSGIGRRTSPRGGRRRRTGRSVGSGPGRIARRGRGRERGGRARCRLGEAPRP